MVATTTDIIVPNGWMCETLSDDEVKFVPERWRLSLHAVRLPNREWELYCRESAGEATSTTTLGFTQTRSSAIAAFVEAMEWINTAADPKQREYEVTEIPVRIAALADHLTARSDVLECETWGQTRGQPSDVAGSDGSGGSRRHLPPAGSGSRCTADDIWESLADHRFRRTLRDGSQNAPNSSTG
ncbi:hypothetical protein [Haloprofundus salinisoli]|uniref:hypothetical protein n=1 Tax=Haloprofundus salinisoli TaxID=2876193 RepID=UPI001CCD1EB2|nr:hypothetical protein [Haloprofundus salinisoli]